MIKINNKQYKKDIKQEEDLWNKTAKKEFNNFPPDYKFYQKTIPYKIYRDIYVKKMLNEINDGDKVLELGCYNGWFSLEMARKGAIVDAHDLSYSAISIAKKYFFQRKKIEKFSGSVNYYVTDLNYPKFQINKYDKIVIRNVLHHLINLKDLNLKLIKSLKRKGLLLVDDALPCGKKEAFITGILLILLPTNIPYRNKLQRIFSKKNIIKRTQGLADAKGASPFEGIANDKHIYFLEKMFKKVYYASFAAFTGTVAGQLKLPYNLKIILLNFLILFDKLLVNLKLIQGTSFFLIAQKKNIS